MNFSEQQLLGSETFVPFSKQMVGDQQIDNKLFLLLGFLRLYCNIEGIVFFSINDLVTELGYTPNHNKGRVNEAFRNHLIWLEQNNYIFVNKDLTKVINNTCIKVQINLDHNIFDMVEYGEDGSSKAIQYVRIFYSAFKNITHMKTSFDKSRLLRLYLVIRKFLDESTNGVKFVYPSISTISKEIGIIKSSNVSNAIDELERIGVIYTYCPGSYTDKNGNTKNTNMYYTFEPNTFAGAYEHALAYVRNLGIDIEKFDPPIIDPHLKKKAVKRKVADECRDLY